MYLDRVIVRYTTNTKCSKWPREECALSKQQTTKFSPLTKCTKVKTKNQVVINMLLQVPVELCGPAGCGFKEGPEECFERVQTVVGDAPEESCNLDAQTTCKHVTKLAPQLEEVEVCFDVPKEVCVRSEVNPRKVAQPVLKKWCYVAECDDECKEAASKGECLPQCEQFRGNDKCCAPCPTACLSAAAARQQCSSQCQRYSGNSKCCFSETAKPTTTRRTTRPSRPRPSTRRPSPTPRPSASPVVAETCPSDCAEAFRRRETLAKCKQFKDEYKDCYYEKCSEECKTSASRGETNPNCRKHLGDKECYVPPSTCPVECQKDAALGFCSSKCKQFEGNPDCCAPTCPAKCTNKRR